MLTSIYSVVIIAEWAKLMGGFHAISGDTNNNGEMNKCWWTNKAS